MSLDFKEFTKQEYKNFAKIVPCREKAASARIVYLEIEKYKEECEQYLADIYEECNKFDYDGVFTYRTPPTTQKHIKAMKVILNKISTKYNYAENLGLAKFEQFMEIAERAVACNCETDVCGCESGKNKFVVINRIYANLINYYFRQSSHCIFIMESITNTINVYIKEQEIASNDNVRTVKFKKSPFSEKIKVILENHSLVALFRNTSYVCQKERLNWIQKYDDESVNNSSELNSPSGNCCMCTTIANDVENGSTYRIGFSKQRPNDLMFLTR